jgi:hypothetical protein
LSLKSPTSGYVEVNLLGIDIHAIHSPWGQTIAIPKTTSVMDVDENEKIDSDFAGLFGSVTQGFLV